jgi:hypothetical protein
MVTHYIFLRLKHGGQVRGVMIDQSEASYIPELLVPPVGIKTVNLWVSKPAFAELMNLLTPWV